MRDPARPRINAGSCFKLAIALESILAFTSTEVSSIVLSTLVLPWQPTTHMKIIFNIGSSANSSGACLITTVTNTTNTTTVCFLSQLLRPLRRRSRRRSPSLLSTCSCGPSAPTHLAAVSRGGHQIPLPREYPPLPPSTTPGWVRLFLRVQGVRMIVTTGLPKGSAIADRLPSYRPDRWVQARMQGRNVWPAQVPDLRI